MFKTNKSVTEILATFKKTLDELAAASNALYEKADQKMVKALDLNKEEQEHRAEAARADAVYKKIFDLISE